MVARRLLMVGNWKMNHTLSEVEDFMNEISERTGELCKNAWIAPQLVHLHSCILRERETTLKFGAQNCSNQFSGAFTGETSPKALSDMGVAFTLVGHSERRTIFNEDDQLLSSKVLRALESELEVILCVGETLQEREEERTFPIVLSQVKTALAGIPEDMKSQIIIAYEPVWAIGTGKVASPAQAQEVHAAIRASLSSVGFDPEKVSILYGGSVKPENVEELLACDDIDGALVGGASLQAADFIALCQAVKRRE